MYELSDFRFIQIVNSITLALKLYEWIELGFPNSCNKNKQRYAIFLILSLSQSEKKISLTLTWDISHSLSLTLTLTCRSTWNS